MNKEPVKSQFVLIVRPTVIFTGYYETFVCWKCNCEKLPEAEEVKGRYVES